MDPTQDSINFPDWMTYQHHEQPSVITTTCQPAPLSCVTLALDSLCHTAAAARHHNHTAARQRYHTAADAAGGLVSDVGRLLTI